MRPAFSVLILVGLIYAAAGLFDSLIHVSIGLVVAMVGVIGFGAVQYVQDRRDDMHLYRERVWMRRDG